MKIPIIIRPIANEQDVWFWLWTRARPFYRLVAMLRLVDLLIMLNVLSPTDEDALNESQKLASKSHKAFYQGCAARRTAQSPQPPYLDGTAEYKAWLDGWNYEKKHPSRIRLLFK